MESHQSNKKANALINEGSPYLLQHAYNPVNWVAWSDEVLQRAKAENKMLLISIGYAACHWCHVMERECFEDDSVAALMNAHFICVKVDREERPDIDMTYMSAIQVMGKSGGWPLNFFALPDGSPFYGGTYFPKDQWVSVLKQVAKEWGQNPTKIKEYAANLSAGVQQAAKFSPPAIKSEFSIAFLKNVVQKWKTNFDNTQGGPLRDRNKFPLPNNYLFLLKYAHLQNDNAVLDHVRLSLNKMAKGGIYDQIGGGFSRYSTDPNWKVPHFEKMLYDNAQMISLYGFAYQKWKDPLYLKALNQTIQFIEDELYNEKYHCFYSAIDADSEGEEGKFYVWTKEELKAVLGKEYDFVEHLYNINKIGYWENNHYILLRTDNQADICKRFNLTEEAFYEKKKTIDALLLKHRNRRIRPGLDDKSLVSWNALMIKAYADAYGVTQNVQHLNKAIATAEFIFSAATKSDGGLWHNFKNGKANIEGFLEDYAFFSSALIRLYEVSSDELYLQKAEELLQYVLMHFSDPENPLFYFTSNLQPAVVSRNKEIDDNVMPSSNSELAIVLYKLGLLRDNKTYLTRSKEMVLSIIERAVSYGSAYSNWLALYMDMTGPYYQVAITGKEAISLWKKAQEDYTPNALFMLSEGVSSLPLLKDKTSPGTTIFVCQEGLCKMPVNQWEEAKKQMP